MNNLKDILDQVELGKNAIEEMKRQNRIFDATLQEALKGAPDSDKKEIQAVQVLSLKVINLAKEGKTNEAQNLIKEFQNGRKSNK